MIEIDLFRFFKGLELLSASSLALLSLLEVQELLRCLLKPVNEITYDLRFYMELPKGTLSFCDYLILLDI
jgi:hypothetical protein